MNPLILIFFVLCFVSQILIQIIINRNIKKYQFKNWKDFRVNAKKNKALKKQLRLVRILQCLSVVLLYCSLLFCWLR